jgi:hypothetical protein
MNVREDMIDDVVAAAEMVALAPQGAVQSEAVDHLVDILSDARCVEFEELLEATEVVPDDHISPGDWRIEDDCHLVPDDNADKYIIRRGRRYAVRPSAKRRREVYRLYRQQGASRGVAWQLADKQSRNVARDAIVRYNNPPQYCGVVCEYAGRHSSCWSYDCEKYAGDCKAEIADEMAAQLVRDGWTVVNRPDWKAIAREETAQRFRRGVHLQDMRQP